MPFAYVTPTKPHGFTLDRSPQADDVLVQLKRAGLRVPPMQRYRLNVARNDVVRLYTAGLIIESERVAILRRIEREMIAVAVPE